MTEAIGEAIRKLDSLRGGDIFLQIISPVDFGKNKLLLKKNILKNILMRKEDYSLIKKREITGESILKRMNDKEEVLPDRQGS